ncbi:MAG TPA: STAS domain-containing protein [Gemmataceae bacterium]|nr:STAS domain-containing protein [Gemmataceae bacterium]
MDRPYRHIEIDRTGDVHCVRLCQAKMDETALYELADELDRLVSADGCRKLLLSLGPEEPQFLYSVFLAKLVTLQRRLQAGGGALKLCEVSDDTRKIFDACRLTPLFDFVPNRTAGLAAFQK